MAKQSDINKVKAIFRWEKGDLSRQAFYYNKVYLGFILFAIGFWLVSALLQYYYFNNFHVSFMSCLFPLSEIRELVNRFLFILAFIIAGYLFRGVLKTLIKEKVIEDKLTEKLTITLQSIGDGVITTDENGLITNMNPTAEKLCAWTLEEAYGLPLLEVFKIKNSKTGISINDPVKKVLETGKIVGLANHTILVSKFGEEYHISDSAAPIKDQNSKITGVVLVFSDVSEKYQIEESLRKSEERFRHLAYLLPLTVYETDLQGVLTYVNQRGLETFGYTEDEIKKGISAYHFIKPQYDEMERMKKIIQNSIKNNVIERRESIGIKKDGREFPILIFSNVVIIDKEPIGFRGVVIDLSEQKNTEVALIESEENYRRLTENMSDVAWTVDLNFVTTYVSPSVQRVLGYSVEEYLQRPISSNYTPESLALIMEVYEENVRLEKDPSSDKKRNKILQVEQYKADGSTIWVSLNATFFRNKEGIPIGLQGITRDIDDLKKAEFEKDKLYEQLLQAQKMESIGRLAGGVAHDFNNMLGVIIGHADFALAKAKGFDNMHTHLLEIRKAAERSANLTRQLLAFARKQEIEPKVLDLNTTIEGMLKLLRRLIGEDIDFLWQPGYNLWAIKVDPSQIDQILANLCVNARDAITGIGKIIIETENVTLDQIYCDVNAGFMPGNYVRLSVNDNGNGIDKEILPHIFEPFFTTKEMGKGTGLGLATIYGAVKQSNGFINVYSEKNQGTTFNIYFPQFIFPSDHESDEESIHTLKTGSETVLLVEDESSILNMTVMMLESLGYKVFSTASPKDALGIIESKQNNIEILITDVIMPEMNGKELVDAILKLQPDLKYIFISGYTSNVIASHGIFNRDLNFIQKPFTIDRLAECMRRLLDKK